MSNASNPETPPDPVQHPPELSDQTWRSEHLQEPSKVLSMGCLMPLATLVVGGTILLVVPAIQVTPARGATRSSRLQWQERQAEIQQALAEQREYLAQCEGELENPTE